MVQSLSKVVIYRYDPIYIDVQLFRKNKTYYKHNEENIMFLPKMGIISEYILLLTCHVFYHLSFSVYYL